LGSKSFAQADLTMYNMNWIPQSMYQNPALTPPTKVNIGLPLISSNYFQFVNTGFAWKDLFALDANDSLDITVDNMLNKLGRRNFLNFNANLDLLSFGFKTGKAYIGFNITERIYSRFTYPEDFFRLAWKGNVQFLGGEADLKGLGLDAGAYTEIGLNYTREVDEDGRLKIGGRLKYNNGIVNVHTQRSDITLGTDADLFYLTANSDLRLNTSGIYQFINPDSNSTVQPGALALGKNHGVGIDLGMNWEIIPEKLRVSASLVDLGFIRWKNDPFNLTTNEATFTFEGIDITDFPAFGDTTIGNYIDSLFQAIGDSIVGTFNPDTTYEAYTAPTIPRFYLGGNYLINEHMDAGLLFSGEIYKGVFRPTVTASYNLRVGRFMQVSASWSYANRSILNPGFGISLNGGPLQVYLVTDNVLAFFAPQSARQAHLHSGFNLTFGRDKRDRDKDGVPDKEDTCPDVPGLAEFAGCPDRDGDKIIDLRDTCPDVPGLAKFDGCPDRDGDDIQDSQDNCPDEAGLAEFNGCPDRDGDKIMDKEDACPDQAGPKSTNGCPDRDNDGVVDTQDACPDKAGPAEHQGCPDTDGDGLYDNEDKCPDEFGPQDNFGCPYGDLDKDGVYDREDRCVDTPGPRENQGCPYADLDGDGVTDNVDDCPNQPGPASNKGCPEKLTKAFEIAERTKFASGKAIILEESKPALDTLVARMLEFPDVRIQLVGHTDSDGSEAANLTLSKNRTIAIRDYLVGKGISATRFETDWKGESMPVDTNATPQGKANNRRVEITVIKE